MAQIDHDGIIFNDEGVTLTGCQMPILKLVEWLKAWATGNNMTLIISSGYRSAQANDKAGGSPKSKHLKGMAVDFSFKGVNVFKVVSALYGYWLSGVGAWSGMIDFEVCRGGGMQHIHVSMPADTSEEKRSYTGVYK